MLRLIGEVVGVTLGICAVLGILWRVVILPNLRQHLLEPVRQSHKQLTENKHANRAPTVLDRLEDLEQQTRDVANHVDLLALNQLAVLRVLGSHVGESTRDREHLWLTIESLIHEQKGKP